MVSTTPQVSSPTSGKKLNHQHVHHSTMVEDFRKRFWISLVLTLPILLLSPMIQEFLSFGQRLRFGGDSYALWALSSIVFFYGGFPFLQGILNELKKKKPGMMTLIAIAISTELRTETWGRIKFLRLND